MDGSNYWQNLARRRLSRRRLLAGAVATGAAFMGASATGCGGGKEEPQQASPAGGHTRPCHRAAGASYEPGRHRKVLLLGSPPPGHT